jgi:8-oxo-dGTP diphosphatase
MSDRQVVVGVAVIRDSKVLAALRGGAEGGWEFPGGKVEPGETDEQAAIREIREELGLEIGVGPVLGDDEPIGDRLLLRVYLGWVIDGEPVPHEHAELRWLGAGELDRVSWLPADEPFVEGLRHHLRGSGTPQPDPRR